MRSLPSAARAALPILALFVLTAGVVPAQSPGEVTGVGFSDVSTLSWNPVAGADFHHVYRGELQGIHAGRCHGFELAGPPFGTGAAPPPGEGYFYLVTAESIADGEGTPGSGSDLIERPLIGRCEAVMRNHVVDRLGYGWDEWTRDRVEALGLDAYIAEQLDPLSISELSNIDLQSRLAAISRPESIVHLIQQQVIRAVYARRQLEQQAATFWANHFSTDWTKIAQLYQGAFPPCVGGEPPQCDPDYPARAYLEASMDQHLELADFRRLAFDGNFREMVEASALSPAMIIYLDTVYSVAGAPNENYPRELMELHTIGVDGGYTQTDVEELSRVITGWTLCKKANTDIHDPLAPCIPEYWDDDVPGRIVATYNVGQHDCTAKTLFAGTPQEFTIPDTCSTPLDGAQDLFTALDHIVAHPSTPRFISRKILERFVTEDPDASLIDALVAVWNDAGNPHGVGDMRAVLEAALTLDVFLDPDRIRSKIKTPFEQFVSSLRAARGRTDGSTGIISFLVTANHIPHYNPVPTGWPELGADWIGTNNYLERQNFVLSLLESVDPDFSVEPIDLLNDNGVTTAPGNAEAIVDFLADAFMGGALTPAERQAAIDFLNTDDTGIPAPYDDARIRDVVALLMGYPQFQEQ
jgi:uncharacterized protein (DUF1800 family)